jgi:hypothetical protein
LDGAVKGDVVQVEEAIGVEGGIGVFYNEGLAFAGDVGAGGVEVEGTGFVVGGDEAANGLRRVGLRETHVGDKCPSVAGRYERNVAEQVTEIELELGGGRRGIFDGKTSEETAFVRETDGGE